MAPGGQRPARASGWRGIRVTRDLVLFAAGLLFAAHEVFVSGLDRPGVLVLAGGMIGLPPMLRRDERDARERDGGG